MSNSKRKWWLAVVALCCLPPAAFAGQDRQHGDCDRGCGPHWWQHPCQQKVPEGGSTAIYLLGAGLTCCGAMFLRSRIAKPGQS